MVRSLIKRFETNRIFNEEEAWALFRLAAIAEAGGWTLLILGIGFEQYIMPGNHISVLLAGRIHGLLFSLYALSAVGLYPALGWPRKKAFVALLASVPPYGSLAFEQWAKYMRQTSHFKTYRRTVLLTYLNKSVQ
jgi:integral membrane protein